MMSEETTRPKINVLVVTNEACISRALLPWMEKLTSLGATVTGDASEVEDMAQLRNFGSSLPFTLKLLYPSGDDQRLHGVDLSRNGPRIKLYVISVPGTGGPHVGRWLYHNRQMFLDEVAQNLDETYLQAADNITVTSLASIDLATIDSAVSKVDIHFKIKKAGRSITLAELLA